MVTAGDPHADLLAPFRGAPIPLRRTRSAAPFPVEVLPSAIRLMVEAVAEATQTALGMAGTAALGAISTAVGGHARIEVRDGWEEGTNLYTVTIALPGERKSAVLRLMTSPLEYAEQQLTARMGAQLREARTRRLIAERRAEKAQALASRARGSETDSAIADAIAAAEDVARIEVPSEPRLVADDTTAEALASLLVEQHGRVAVISAEGGIFDTISGRYSSVPSLDVYLKGYSGDQLRVDRKGRPAEHVSHPALTMSLMVQPSVLAAIGRNDTFRGRGLLARFLYCYPDSRLGHRRASAPGVPRGVSDAYNDFVVALVETFFDQRSPAKLVMDGEAQSVIVRLEEELEPQLVGDGELSGMSDWGAKYVGAVCRIAGLLHVANHRDNAHRVPISAATVKDAIEIGAFYKQHSVAAFGEMRLDAATREAEQLLALIGRIGKPDVSVRELFSRASRSVFGTVKALAAPLEVLVDHGWIAAVENERERGPGRPSSPRYAVHAAALSAKTAESVAR